MPSLIDPASWAMNEANLLENSLSVSDKAAQLIMTVIDGKESLPPYFTAHFKDCVPGAILLFRYNFAAEPSAVHAFLSRAQAGFTKHGLPVLFALDHEGGDVYRTGLVTTKLPSQELIAETYSAATAAEIYRNAALELRSLGIALNLAPVAEVSTSDNRSFLGSRTFSADSAQAVDFASAAVRGIQSAGMLSALKHFPGSGADDPHTGSSSMLLSRERFNEEILKPFRSVLEAEPTALLVSHVSLEWLEPGVPFCLSRKGVTGIVRGDLGYRGLILTDDLSMGAIRSFGLSAPEAAVRAIEAGCDLVMISDPDIIPVRDALAEKMRTDPSFAKRAEESVNRIIRAKLNAGLPVTGLGRKALSTRSLPDLFDGDMYNWVRQKTLRTLETHR